MALPHVSAEHLRQFVERIETLEAERAAVGQQIREVYAEAKASGYDVRTLRAVVRLRAMDGAKRAEAEALLETYKAALGLA
ncbi:MAG: DUF2312 domain-containing protein [Sphingomonadaceae bacterium]|uniref:DUF2312 domain-containing protein n=1 Tax=Thermaurantiacus sp. TaxID=2820283 RepID=UPI00298F2D19|nr:DUF2312 domain-containing protein [Thermaurantiacus sp.]MCS6986324.1 DUF2312 domain-containing protein [Sphingomonadaceae bacterium]MDW8414414.1 DUF2312 domain-containing protein [Thermaurantiacus sp.]